MKCLIGYSPTRWVGATGHQTRGASEGLESREARRYPRRLLDRGERGRPRDDQRVVRGRATNSRPLRALPEARSTPHHPGLRSRRRATAVPPRNGPSARVHLADRHLDLRQIDVSFAIISDSNTRQLSKTDPARQVIRSKAREPLLERFFDRAANGEVRWNVTLFPTEAHAMDAEMSLAEYEDFFYGACLIDVPDPVAEWKKTADRHAQLIGWLKGRNEVHITGEGTDLTLEVADRIFLPADGKENFPDGEIFTGPIETATRGHVTFSFPANYGGQSVEGIRLEFADGKVVDATATKNEEFLIKTLDTDEGARILGELGIGTNYGITDHTGETLLDEKIGGTIHLAVGASYPESGGTNKSA